MTVSSSPKSVQLWRRALPLLLGLYFVLFITATLLAYVSPAELLIQERTTYQGINLEPFRTIRNYWRATSVSQTVILNNILGNILLFLPLGILLPAICRAVPYWRHLVLMIFLSLTVEILQYFLHIGASDIDDILLNVLGGMLGLSSVAAWRCISRRHVKNQETYS